MKIRKKSPFTGKYHEMDLDISTEQFNAWQAGELIQDAMPHLSSEEREFLISGIPPKEWNDTFGS